MTRYPGRQFVREARREGMVGLPGTAGAVRGKQ